MENCKAPITDSIVCLAARLENIADRYVFGPMGMSAASFKILGVLSHADRMTPGEILRFTGGSKSNVSQRLRFLEKEGLIRRLSDSGAKDRRHVAVSLTPAGRKKVASVARQFAKAHLKLEEHFTKKEIQAHLAFFRKLGNVLEAEEKNLASYFPRPRKR
jgi:DNA-binding MarR family transcriptional regulator